MPCLILCRGSLCKGLGVSRKGTRLVSSCCSCTVVGHSHSSGEEGRAGCQDPVFLGFCHISLPLAMSWPCRDLTRSTAALDLLTPCQACPKTPRGAVQDCWTNGPLLQETLKKKGRKSVSHLPPSEHEATGGSWTSRLQTILLQPGSPGRGQRLWRGSVQQSSSMHCTRTGAGTKKSEFCLESGAGSLQLMAGRWLQLTRSRSCPVLMQPCMETCLGLPLAKQTPRKGPILPSTECLRAVAAPVEQRHCSVQNFTELISVEETPFLSRHFCGQTSSQPTAALPGLEGGYFGGPVAPFI